MTPGTKPETLLALQPQPFSRNVVNSGSGSSGCFYSEWVSECALSIRLRTNLSVSSSSAFSGTSGGGGATAGGGQY